MCETDAPLTDLLSVGVEMPLFNTMVIATSMCAVVIGAIFAVYALLKRMHAGRQGRFRGAAALPTSAALLAAIPVLLFTFISGMDYAFALAELLHTGDVLIAGYAPFSLLAISLCTWATLVFPEAIIIVLVASVTLKPAPTSKLDVFA